MAGSGSAPTKGKRQDKGFFAELPQPPPLPAVKATVDDSYLKGLENYIDALSAHILKIQDDELETTKKFSEELKELRAVPADKRAKKEEHQRNDYLKKISTVRERRKQFRELLYDALQERKRLWESMQLQKDDELNLKRKMKRLLVLPEAEKQKLTRKIGFPDWFSVIFSIFQAGLIILFGIGTEFRNVPDSASSLGTLNRIDNFSTFYTNIALWVFIGLAFLMSYLKKYGYSAVGDAFMLSAFSIQWSVLVLGFFDNSSLDVHLDGWNWQRIPLGFDNFIGSLYGCTVVLIAIGATLGKTSQLQQLLLAAVIIPIFGLNHFIGDHLLYAVHDLGGSIFIWTFGSFFGLAFSLAFGKVSSSHKAGKDAESNESRYDSDLFAIFGTVFLWVLWPSFNAAFSPDGTQHRVVINTVLALCSSAIFTFIFSRVLRGGKFNISDIQRSSLSGGIAMASCASFLIGPGGALVVGSVAGTISTISHIHFQPLLYRYLGLEDTIGTLSIYGIPGIIGALNGIISAGIATNDQSVYGVSMHTLFPDQNDHQAGWNLLVLLITLGISILSGGILGLILGKFTNPLKYYYSDEVAWDTPADFELQEANTANKTNA